VTDKEGKRKLTEIELAECHALKMLFQERKKPLRLTQESIGAAMGISQSAVGHYFQGRNPLNLQAALKFATLLQADLASFSPRLAKEAENLAVRVSLNRDYTVKEREPIHLYSLPEGKRIEVKSFAQIISNEQGTDTMIVFGDLPESAYAYKLETDHMEGQPVYIQRGAMLVIDPDLEPVEGDVILANVADHPTIGIFERVGGRCMAVATRDKIPAVEVTPDQVLGVVLEWKVQHRNPSRGTLS